VRCRAPRSPAGSCALARLSSRATVRRSCVRRCCSTCCSQAPRHLMAVGDVMVMVVMAKLAACTRTTCRRARVRTSSRLVRFNRTLIAMCYCESQCRATTSAGAVDGHHGRQRSWNQQSVERTLLQYGSEHRRGLEHRLTNTLPCEALDRVACTRDAVRCCQSRDGERERERPEHVLLRWPCDGGR